MTYPNALTSPAQSGWPVVVNENLEALGHTAVYSNNYATSTGLTWGYHGGRWGGFAVADGTFSLTNAASNYIVAKRSDGVTSASTATTNWNNTSDYARVYKVTTAGSVVTAIEDHRAGLYGVHGQATDPAAASVDSVNGQTGVVVLDAGDIGITNTDFVATDVEGALAELKADIAGGTGDVATDVIWDAKGDLAVGTGANTAAKLTVGTNTYVLTADSGEATGLKWAAPSAGAGTKTYGVFTPMTSQPPASNFATLDTRNSIAVLDFDDSTEESAFWVGVMHEAASLGSGLIINIFFMATSATSGDCRFGAQFERMTTDEDSDSFDTATEATVATSGTSGIVTKLSITCTTIDSIAAGEPYRLKIYRDTSGADTITGDVEVVAVELRSAA